MLRYFVTAILMLGFGCGVHGQDQPSAPSATLAPSATKNPSAADQEAGFLPLFDGKLLSNWEGKAYWFRVEDKSIVAGRLDQRIPNNFFLCTSRKFADFELRLQVKVIGEGVNAGIQFRTQRIPGSDEVSGYQADVGGVGEKSVWGALYDESRRKRMLAEPKPELISKLVRPDDWNDYVIRCVGPKIEIFVNGEKTVDYTETEPGIATDGVIALQIHGGPPSEAWYRHLRIKPL
ncbi:MAG: 3-keto-disaccharide hydrolase [Planctomycetaceae bacterium]